MNDPHEGHGVIAAMWLCLGVLAAVLVVAA